MFRVPASYQIYPLEAIETACLIDGTPVSFPIAEGLLMDFNVPPHSSGFASCYLRLPSSYYSAGAGNPIYYQGRLVDRFVVHWSGYAKITGVDTPLTGGAYVIPGITAANVAGGKVIIGDFRDLIFNETAVHYVYSPAYADASWDGWDIFCSVGMLFADSPTPSYPGALSGPAYYVSVGIYNYP